MAWGVFTGLLGAVNNNGRFDFYYMVLLRTLTGAANPRRSDITEGKRMIVIQFFPERAKVVSTSRRVAQALRPFLCRTPRSPHRHGLFSGG